MKNLIYLLVFIPFILLAKQPEVSDVWLLESADPFNKIKFYNFVMDVKSDKYGNRWCKILYRLEGDNQVNEKVLTATVLTGTSDFLRKATYQDSLYFKLIK